MKFLKNWKKKKTKFDIYAATKMIEMNKLKVKKNK